MKFGTYHYVLVAMLFLVSCCSIHIYTRGEKWKDDDKPTKSVAFSSIALVISIGLVGYGLYTKFSKRSGSTTTVPFATATAPVRAAIAPTTVTPTMVNTTAVAPK